MSDLISPNLAIFWLLFLISYIYFWASNRCSCTNIRVYIVSVFADPNVFNNCVSFLCIIYLNSIIFCLIASFQPMVPQGVQSPGMMVPPGNRPPGQGPPMNPNQPPQSKFITLTFNPSSFKISNFLVPRLL